ncbi:uncharacterized protein LOC123513399 [Portunus trituberculatus]|uniref:uncharacterized protein LOC123513399 n=1 Tax=Portunus trituberculatus TaxID=210409 RepID=UPI001E1CD645|nr:uncharacterized protein LOC123513399 [Portunus trituberculatus]XP_045126473.1 uncharacterized protein LOC123513399 [Portunus trituberculatus]XP_045126474.1 uncharacterized protein LOC123513399 [Portunus trituberculatus]XP_045126475.1 uncharacterized protein LOC123513399 [Portunus trituberculatus]
MQARLLVVAMTVVVVTGIPTPQLTDQPAPQSSAQPAPQVTLEEAFADRAVVEAMVDCFIDNTKCDAEQTKIRERAMAAMMNMGRCPATLCTEQQQLEMTRAMELLQDQHKDLWIKLLISMFNLDLP